MRKYAFLFCIVLANFGYGQNIEYYYPQEYSYPSYVYYNQSKSVPQSVQPSPTCSSNSINDSAKKTEEKKEEKKEECKEEKKEEPKSPHSFTGNVSIVSDYRFRGISQTMRHPAIQGGFDYSHIPSGIYFGTWASNVDGTTHFFNNTSMEWDLYGGFKGKPFKCSAPDFGYNVGLLYYYYPGGKAFNPHNTKYNTAEVYLELTYKWISIKSSETFTNYFGINSQNTPFNWDDETSDSPNGSSRGSNYTEINVTFDLMDKVCLGRFHAGKLNILLHGGHQYVRHYGHLSYTDWKVTLTQEFAWFNAFISYVGTNAKHAYYDVQDNAFDPRKHALGAQGFVFGVIKSF